MDWRFLFHVNLNLAIHEVSWTCFASAHLQMCNSMGITPAYTNLRGQSITYAEKLLEGAERPV